MKRQSSCPGRLVRFIQNRGFGERYEIWHSFFCFLFHRVSRAPYHWGCVCVWLGVLWGSTNKTASSRIENPEEMEKKWFELKLRTRQVCARSIKQPHRAVKNNRRRSGEQPQKAEKEIQVKRLTSAENRESDERGWGGGGCRLKKTRNESYKEASMM